jgi:hypothetical protein
MSIPHYPMLQDTIYLRGLGAAGVPAVVLVAIFLVCDQANVC